MENNEHLRISDLFSYVKKIELVLENSRELKALVKRAQVGACFLESRIEVLVPRHNCFLYKHKKTLKDREKADLLLGTWGPKKQHSDEVLVNEEFLFALYSPELELKKLEMRKC